MRMLRIILCDDNESTRENLKKHIVQFFGEKEEVEFVCYENGYELIRQWNLNDEKWADILFLDITMPVMDGMKTARIF